MRETFRITKNQEKVFSTIKIKTSSSKGNGKMISR